MISFHEFYSNLIDELLREEKKQQSTVSSYMECTQCRMNTINSSQKYFAHHVSCQSNRSGNTHAPFQHYLCLLFIVFYSLQKQCLLSIRNRLLVVFFQGRQNAILMNYLISPFGQCWLCGWVINTCSFRNNLKMFSALLVVCVSLSLYLLYRWARRNDDYFKNRGIPYIQPNLLLGTTGGLFFGRYNMMELSEFMYKALPNERYLVIKRLAIYKSQISVHNLQVTKQFINWMRLEYVFCETEETKSETIRSSLSLSQESYRHQNKLVVSSHLMNYVWTNTIPFNSQINWNIRFHEADILCSWSRISSTNRDQRFRPFWGSRCLCRRQSR